MLTGMFSHGKWLIEADGWERMGPVVFGTLLMVLALYKAPQYWRQAGFRGSNLVILILKDQLLYFAL